MRLEVAVRKSSFLWRQTDDRRYPCVLRRDKRRAKVLICGHYELGVCTDETSAEYAYRARSREQLSASRRGWPLSGRLTCARYDCSVASKDLQNGIRGIGRNLIPHPLRTSNEAEAHAVSVRRVIP